MSSSRYEVMSDGVMKIYLDDATWAIKLVRKHSPVVIRLSLIEFTNQPASIKFIVEFLNQEDEVLTEFSSTLHEYIPDKHNWYFSIPKPKLLSENDKLSLRCQLIELDSMSNNIAYQRRNEGYLSEDLSPLFENPEFSDVTISVKNKDYSAHKCILAARSPVFAAMFKHDYQENRLNRVEIKDIDENVMEEMLRFIYTGKCENLESLAEELLAAADKYALDRLKIICSKKFVKALSIENAANILLLADMYHVGELKACVLQFIVDNSTEVYATDGWKSVMSNPQLIEEVEERRPKDSKTQSDEPSQDGSIFWGTNSLYNRIVNLFSFE